MTGHNHCAHVFTWLYAMMQSDEPRTDGETFELLSDALVYLAASH